MRNKISLVFFILCILFGLGAVFCFSTNKPKESVPTVGTTESKENVPTASTTESKENVPTAGTTESKENASAVGTKNKTREGWIAPQTGEDDRQTDFIVALFFCTLSFFSICACIRYKLNQACRFMF